MRVIEKARQAALAAETVFGTARARIAARLMPGGKLSAALLDREQHAAHGLAWLATYAAVLRELTRYAERLVEDGRLGETEQLLVEIAAGEYLNQIAGGIPMNQGEFVRAHDLGLRPPDLAPLYDCVLLEEGNTAEARGAARRTAGFRSLRRSRARSHIG